MMPVAGLLPFWVMKTSLIGLPFTVGTPLVIVVALALGWRRAHRARSRVALTLASVAGVVLAVAIGVNAYFAYFPSVGSMLGRRAVDEASWTRIRRLRRQHSVPSHGLVAIVHIPGALRSRRAELYLPPAWFRHPRPTLDAIELLHGTPGMPEDWTRAGFADVTLDHWAKTHGGLAPVVVMPDPNGSFTRDTECVDGRLGRAETYLSRDVPAWVERHAGVRGRWAIAGSSEGGYCAVTLAARHPDRYAAFADFSGLGRPTHAHGVRWLLGSKAVVRDHLPSALLARSHGPPGWFAVGGADRGPRRAAQHLSAELSQWQPDTRLVVVPSAHHTWRVWRHSFAEALPWLVRELSRAR